MRIREFRKARGWTQSVLAEKAGTLPNRISILERPGGSPRPATLKKLALVFGCSIDELLEEPVVA